MFKNSQKNTLYTKKIKNGIENKFVWDNLVLVDISLFFVVNFEIQLKSLIQRLINHFVKA